MNVHAHVCTKITHTCPDINVHARAHRCACEHKRTQESTRAHTDMCANSPQRWSCSECSFQQKEQEDESPSSSTVGPDSPSPWHVNSVAEAPWSCCALCGQCLARVALRDTPYLGHLLSYSDHREHLWVLTGILPACSSRGPGEVTQAPGPTSWL